MRDKAIGEIAEILFPLADKVIATQPENPRAATPQEIQQAAVRSGAEIEAVENVQRAIERARGLAGAGAVMVVTGSIYMVGEVMREIGIEV
jgi:dihydrofolate synthase/folylpolyglutamate synthase